MKCKSFSALGTWAHTRGNQTMLSNVNLLAGILVIASLIAPHSAINASEPSEFKHQCHSGTCRVSGQTEYRDITISPTTRASPRFRVSKSQEASCRTDPVVVFLAFVVSFFVYFFLSGVLSSSGSGSNMLFLFGSLLGRPEL